MATVCVGCGLDLDGDGKLIVDIAPGTPASPNHLECGPAGLTVRQKRKHLRRSFTAVGQTSVAALNGFTVDRAMTGYGTVEDNGSGTPGSAGPPIVPAVLGHWTINANGTLTINIPGLYLVSQQTLVEGTTGQVVGGRARVIEGAGLAAIIATSEFQDHSGTVSLAVVNDGPEWSASAVRHLQAGDIISYISNVYTKLLGQSVDYAGEFTITYLGEFA